MKYSNARATPIAESPGLASARVLQLKREIEELDARLTYTNTINFEDIRQVPFNDTHSSSNHGPVKGNEIED